MDLLLHQRMTASEEMAADLLPSPVVYPRVSHDGSQRCRGSHCTAPLVQATAKGGSKVGKSGFRDLWLLTLTLIINAITVAVGLFQVRPENLMSV